MACMLAGRMSRARARGHRLGEAPSWACRRKTVEQLFAAQGRRADYLGVGHCSRQQPSPRRPMFSAHACGKACCREYSRGWVLEA